MPYILKPDSTPKPLHCMLSVQGVAKPSHADSSEDSGNRRRFDENDEKKLKALLFAELLNSVPSRQFASWLAQVQWEHNEIRAVTDGALRTANGCAGIRNRISENSGENMTFDKPGVGGR